MMEIRVLNYETIPSTNSEALAQARMGAPEGLCIVADEQTDGRGRNGRRWISPKGAGLYFSAVLRPSIARSDFPLLTLAAAVAVCEVLTGLYKLEPDIKWPNDILIEDQKICGILAESAETAAGPAVVIGIGVNLLKTAESPELGGNAVSIESAAGRVPDKEDLTGALAKSLLLKCGTICDPGSRSSVLSDWTRLSSWADGKQVRVETKAGTVEGITAGILETGALRINTGDGIIEISAGDVTSAR